MSENVVTTEWLAQNVSSPALCILDASWHMPATKRDAKAEFNTSRIPGSQFFDIDALSDTENPLPHMLPSPEKFSSGVRKLGVGDGQKIICYDQSGLFSAARAWWMFKVFGHENVAVLDGGFPKWQAENRPLETGPPQLPERKHFTVHFNGNLVRNRAEVAAALATGSAQLADARGAARFTGLEKEPRAGVRSGHMPGAANAHYASVLNPDSTMKPEHQLAELFSAASIDVSQPIITSCGSGITAAILNLALTQLNAKDHSLYDGSWTDWGSATDTEVISSV